MGAQEPIFHNYNRVGELKVFNKILVPTDLSDFSQRALTTAIDMAQKYDAKINLFYVVADFHDMYDSYDLDFNRIDQRLVADGAQKLEEMLKKIDIRGVEITKTVTPGYPSVAILDQIKREAIELVVMGSHGRGAIMGSILGSVSQKVITHAECPVLIVK